MSNKTRCPLCDHVLTWQPIPKMYTPENVTHIYICPECPFVGLEYFNDKNLEDLKNFLTK